MPLGPWRVWFDKFHTNLEPQSLMRTQTLKQALWRLPSQTAAGRSRENDRTQDRIVREVYLYLRMFGQAFLRLAPYETVKI